MLAHGQQPILRVFPDPDEPDLVARITIAPHAHVTETGRTLFRAIARRHTNRRRFADIAVPPAVLDELVAAVRAEGAALGLADDTGDPADRRAHRRRGARSTRC